MKLVKLSILSIALAVFAASCGEKTADTTTTTVGASTSTIDTVHGAVTPPPVAPADSMHTATSTTTTTTGTGTATGTTPAGTATNGTGGKMEGGSSTGGKMEGDHKMDAGAGKMEDGKMKTKTVTKTDANGNTDTKTKTKVSH